MTMRSFNRMASPVRAKSLRPILLLELDRGARSTPELVPRKKEGVRRHCADSLLCVAKLAPTSQRRVNSSTSLHLSGGDKTAWLRCSDFRGERHIAKQVWNAWTSLAHVNNLCNIIPFLPASLAEHRLFTRADSSSFIANSSSFVADGDQHYSPASTRRVTESVNNHCVAEGDQHFNLHKLLT
jgi:hypothetical protein